MPSNAARFRTLWVRSRAPRAVATSGLLVGLACPTVGVWPLALFGLVPWMRTARGSGVLSRIGEAALFGFVVTLVNDWVLVRALRMFFVLPWRYALLAFVAVGLTQAVLYVPLGAVLGWMARARIPAAAAWASAFLVCEWALPRADRAGLGASLVGAPWVSQLAELGGVGLLSSLVLASNLLLLQALSARGAARLRATGIWCAYAAMACGVGAALEGGTRAAMAKAPALQVAALQPNGGIFDDDAAKEAERLWLRDQTQALAAQGVSLALWPESALRTTLPHELRDARRFVPVGIHVFFGAATIGQRGGEETSHNSVFATDAGGMVEGRYDKWGLVPFAEYVPAWASFARSLFRGRDVPGRGPHFFVHQGRRVGVSVCYEDLLGAGLRQRVARERPELLVNFTNDRWFDHAEGERAHLRMARLRSIETRRYLVRATSTGVTANIDPTGEVVARLPQRERGVLVTSPRWMTKRTLYVQLGEWAYAAAALWLALGLAVRARRREPSASSR